MKDGMYQGKALDNQEIEVASLAHLWIICEGMIREAGGTEITVTANGSRIVTLKKKGAKP